MSEPNAEPAATLGASGSGSSRGMMEKVKERAAASAAEKDRVMKEKMARVQAGLEEAKRQKRHVELRRAEAAKRAKASKPETVEGNLYAGLPEPDPEKDQMLANRLKEKAQAHWHRFPPLPAADATKVIFLDVDGVLRPLTAGGFRAMMVDGEWALKAETADFISAAMLSLRHIVEQTGAIIVLSSEWRRDEPMREGVDNILKDYQMPACATWTPTDLERDLGTENPFKAFAERRAREITKWIAGNPQVRQWVVLDDINMSIADEDRKPGTLRMTERMVQTHRKNGLTLENAKAAVKILMGEKIPPQILEKQPHIELV